MPFQLRHRTRVATTESASSSSTASSATLEHNEGNADEPLLKKGSGTERLERGLSRSNNASESQLLLAGLIVLNRNRTTERELRSGVLATKSKET
jgi:hypothetical protein